MRRAALALALGSGAVAGCSGVQSALDPAGPAAETVLETFDVFLAVAAVVWLAVVAALAASLLRRRPAMEPAAAPDPLAEAPTRRAAIAVTAAVAATVFTISVLATLSFLTGRSLADLADGAPMVLEVTGHRWWWEVRYEDEAPARTFVTANEIRIPVGERVRVKLRSTDVIHSFWVPQLAPKRDAIPGRAAEQTLVAAVAGTYRGQCAEFCGLQHAHMAFTVVAEARGEFEAWRARQLAAAAPPETEAARRGERVFLGGACALCHTVRGTPAGGRVGPDLTHLAGRTTLAAGTLPMTRGALAAWLADPQRIKPGTTMPRVPLDADQLNDLVAYLETLK